MRAPGRSARASTLINPEDDDHSFVLPDFAVALPPQKTVEATYVAKHAGIKVRDTYYHKETPQDAAAKVEQVMQSNPDITGWAMIGGWPLFTDNALKWPPGSIKCVSVDALPPQLASLVGPCG